MKIDHHAVLLRVSDVTSASPEMGDVEVFEFVHEQLGIDEARLISERAYTRPFEKEQQLLLIRTTFITHEAQNALLKILEEPPLSSRFLFVVPTDLQLLPTLLSRLAVSLEVSDVENRLFADFIKADVPDRLSQIEVATKNKDTGWLRAIKQGLLSYEAGSSASSEKEALEMVVRLLLTRGSSNKMLLEHIALILPRASRK